MCSPHTHAQAAACLGLNQEQHTDAMPAGYCRSCCALCTHAPRQLLGRAQSSKDVQHPADGIHSNRAAVAQDLVVSPPPKPAAAPARAEATQGWTPMAAWGSSPSAGPQVPGSASAASAQPSFDVFGDSPFLRAFATSARCSARATSPCMLHARWHHCRGWRHIDLQKPRPSAASCAVPSLTCSGTAPS